MLAAGSVLERQAFRGAAGILQFWANLDVLFEGAKLHVEEPDAVGPSHVLLSARVTASGRNSGFPLDEKIWTLWELRDQKIVRGSAFRSEAEALQAWRADCATVELSPGRSIWQQPATLGSGPYRALEVVHQATPLWCGVGGSVGK